MTVKFEASFKATTEMAKEWQAASMVAEVEAEALPAFHRTTSALERQVEAMEDKIYAHASGVQTVHCGIERGKRFQCLLQLCGQASDRCEPGFRVDENQSRECIR